MTPLNSIIGNSQISRSKIVELFEELMKTNRVLSTKRKNEITDGYAETLKLVRAIQQSGIQMWFYNQNQI
jgi:hypothetical protein